MAPELPGDRQRVAGGIVLAVVARHELPRLELIAPGELIGVAVVLSLPADRQRNTAGAVLAVPAGASCPALSWSHLVSRPASPWLWWILAMAPDLSGDRQRITAGAVLAVPAKHKLSRLELVAPGEPPGVAVAVVNPGYGARSVRRSPADHGRRRPGRAGQAQAVPP